MIEWLLYSFLGLVGSTVALFRPVWALMAITMLQCMPDLGIAERLTELHLVAAFGAIVAVRLFVKPPPGITVRSPIRLLLILFVGLELLSMIWVRDPVSALDGIYKYSKAVALAWILSLFIREQRELLTLLSMFVVVGVMGAIISIYGITVLGLREGGAALFNNTNANAFFFLFSQPFAYALMRGTSKRWLRLGLIGVVALLVVGILATGSRSAMIAAVVLWVAVLLRDRKSFAIYIVAALGVVCLAVAIPYMQKNVEHIQDLEQIGQKHITERSLAGRRALLVNGIKAFMERPILGYGLQNGRFRVAELMFRQPAGSVDREWLIRHTIGGHGDLHNTYLTVAVDLGTAGIVLFLAICFKSIRRAQFLSRNVASADPYVASVIRYLPMALLGIFTVILFGAQHQRPLLWIGIVLPLVLENVLAFENTTGSTVDIAEDRKGMRQIVSNSQQGCVGIRG